MRPALTHRDKSCESRGPLAEGRRRLAAPGTVVAKDDGVDEIHAARPVICEGGPHFVMVFNDPIVTGKKTSTTSAMLARE